LRQIIIESARIVRVVVVASVMGRAMTAGRSVGHGRRVVSARDARAWWRDAEWGWDASLARDGADGGRKE
jgi:hypothetical protein